MVDGRKKRLVALIVVSIITIFALVANVRATPSTIRQEINILTSTYTATNAISSSDERVQLDTGQYSGTAQYYFEAVGSAPSGSTGSIRLRRVGTTTDDATFTLSSFGTSPTRFRSGTFTPPTDATEYFVYIDAGGSGNQIVIKAARIIIIQASDPLTHTQSQIEIGNKEVDKSNTTDAALDYVKYWKYTAANWNPSPSFFAEATYKKADTATFMPTVYAVGAEDSAAAAVTPGLPTGTQVNDLLVMFCETNDQAITVTGWTEATSSPQSDATDATRLTVFWKRATGGDATTTSDSGDHQICRIVGVRNVVSTGDPWDITAGSTDSVSDTSGAIPGFTTTTDNTLVLAAASTGRDANSTSEFGSTISEGIANPTPRVNNTTNAGGGGGIFVLSGDMATAGVYGGTTVTYANASRKGLWSGALKPAIDTSATVTIKLQQDNGSFAGWTDVTNGTMVNASSASGTITRARTITTFSPTDGRNYRLVASISNGTGHTYDIYNAKIVAQQASTAVKDNHNTTETISFNVYGATGTNEAAGQSFTASSSYSLASISLEVRKDGSPTDSIYLELASGSISGTVMATSASVAAVNIPESVVRPVYFNFSSPVSLTNGTKYYIRVLRSGSRDLTNYYYANGVDDSSYSGGGAFSRGSGVWGSESATNDMFFTTYDAAPGIINLEPQYLIINKWEVITGFRDIDTRWDPAEWSGVLNTYYYEANGASGSASSIKTDPNGTPGEIVNSYLYPSYPNKRSEAISMPIAAVDIDTYIVSPALYASRIIVKTTITANLPFLEQANHRWFAEGTVEGSQATVGSALAAQNAEATLDDNDTARLRMNFGVSNADANTSSQDFKLQYAQASGGTCTGGDTYYDLGTALWTMQSTPTRSWNSVTYGNGLYVAVSTSGTGDRVMTSPNGITWTSRTSAADNNWQSITYGNGLFVAVSSSGSGNRVMTSPDGTNWTSRTSAADYNWRSVTYGNGLFVAVSSSGSGNRVMTSPDGTNWTLQDSPVDNNWASVTYGNGLFVAVSDTGTSDRVMTSPDGITWTPRTPASNNNWTSVTYGKGIYVAVSSDGTSNRVMSSPDGTTWTSGTSAPDRYWYSITYGNGMFVAVSYTLGTSMSSVDGMNWTLGTTEENNLWASVTYGNGNFVSVSPSPGNQAITSSPAVYMGGDYTDDKASLVASASDPTQAGTVRDQSYESINTVTNDKSAIAIGEYGRWDFPLDFTYAPRQTAFCFRAVSTNGSSLNSYSTYPRITTAEPNLVPSAPTLSSPANGAIGINTTPSFQFRASDANNDYLRYKIEVCSNSDCTTIVRTIDQTSSQTGWSGQDTETSTAYIGNATLASSTLALHTYQTPVLANDTEYWWRAYAIDPAGSNTFSTASAIFSFTTVSSGPANNTYIDGGIEIRGGTNIGN